MATIYRTCTVCITSFLRVGNFELTVLIFYTVEHYEYPWNFFDLRFYYFIIQGTCTYGRTLKREKISFLFQYGLYFDIIMI